MFINTSKQISIVRKFSNLCLRDPAFFFIGGCMGRHTQQEFRASDCTQEPGRAHGTIWVPGIEPKLAMYKANDNPTVLLSLMS